MDNLLAKTPIFIVSGPSSVGKSRVIKQMKLLYPEIDFIVSYTTRAIRANEVADKDYHFVSEAHFDRMIEEGAFLEWEKSQLGWYGTPYGDVCEAIEMGKCVLMDISSQGFVKLRQCSVEAYGAFLLPESLSLLAERIRARGADRGIVTEADFTLRYQHALEMIRHAGKYDLIKVNEDVKDTAQTLIEWMRTIQTISSKTKVLSDWMEVNKRV